MGLPSAETLEHPSAPASSNDAMEEDAACSEAGNESGPGELAEAPTHEEAAQSRRSSLSLREKTLCALEEARFPAYPAVSAKEVDFALPDGFIDNDAPLSARKWCALASLISAQPRLQGAASAAVPRLRRRSARATLQASGPVQRGRACHSGSAPATRQQPPPQPCILL